MAERRVDRRVERTRKLLRDALLALMIERGYEFVTIQDIVDRAGVGRSTFYAHFRDKKELLLDNTAWGGLLAELRAASAKTSATAPLALSLPFFRHVDSFRAVFKAVAGGRTGNIVERKIRALLTTAVREAFAKQYLSAPAGVPVEASVQYIVGALFSVMVWWLEQRRRIDPEEIDAMFQRLLRG